MTKPTIFIAAATFFVFGFGVDLLIEPSGLDDGKQTASAQQSIPLREGPIPPLTRAQKFEDLLREMVESDSEEQMARLDELDSEDYPTLIEAFLSKSGIMGLDRPDFALLERTVVSWSSKDRSAALSWALTLESERERRSLLSNVVEGVCEVNLDEGLVFLNTIRQTYGERVSISEELIAKATSSDADSLIRMICDPNKKFSGSGTIESGPYAEDFDFAMAMNGIADYQATKGPPNRIPYNLLSEWAKRDAQAALDWLSLGKKVSFNSDPSLIIRGYREVASEADVGALVADLHQARGKYRETWKMLSTAGSESAFREFLSATSESGDQSQLIQSLVNESLTSSGAGARTIRNELLTRMNAQERIEIFTGNNPPRRPMNRMAYAELLDVLDGLGHPPEEVDRMTQRYDRFAKK